MYTTKSVLAESGFIMYKILGTDYFFQFKTAAGECLLSSERFKNRSTCLHQIVMVQKSVGLDERYLRKSTTEGRHFFLLLNEDGIVVGKSAQYHSITGLEKSITHLKEYAPRSSVRDVT